MKWHKLIMWSLINGLLILTGIHAKNVKKRGVMDNFNDGLKVAGQMFGINTAADVANLVAKAFSNNNNNRNKNDLFSLIQKGLKLSPSQSSSSEEGKNDETQNNYESQEKQQQSEQATEFKKFQTAAAQAEESVGANFGASNLIASMLRLVGFDATKLGALAINALIMIASAIGNTIMGNTQPTFSKVNGGRLFNKNVKSKTNDSVDEDNAETGPEEKYSSNDHEPRAVNDATTIEWFLQNSSGKMKRILKDATHNDLANKITDMITNYESEEGQAACLKMLVCKSSPFIWGMQKSIRKHIQPNDKNENENLDEEDLLDKTDKRLFNVQNFFTHLPSVEEYRENGEKCEKLYSINCNTTDLYDKKY